MTQTDPSQPPNRLRGTRHRGIYRRGSRYLVQVTIGGRKVTRSAPTVTEAKALKAELIAQRHRGTYAHADPATLSEHAERWLAGYQGRSSGGVRPGTVEGYRDDLRLHVLPALGSRPLGAIRTTHVKRLAKELREGTAPASAGHTRRPLSPASVRAAIAPLRALLADAVSEGLIPTNPAAGLRLPGQRLGERTVRALEAEEYAALIAAAPDGMARCLLRVLGEGGLRISEALGLRWGDLELAAEPPTLRVEHAWTVGEYAPPKSSHGRRTVPLRRDLARELTAWRLASHFSLDSEPVFSNEQGRPHDTTNLRRRVLDPARDAAGLERFGWHRLRHTCATTLLAEGVAPLTVSRLLGPHSAAFTLDVYGHVRAGDLLDLDALDAAGAR